MKAAATAMGTVFKITTAGCVHARYTRFTGGTDGGNPWGGLVQAADGNLYGTTQSGGTYGFGTVFQIAPGGALNTVAQFDGYNGANPSAALMQGTDGNLYGTTEDGGSAGDGAIFQIAVNRPAANHRATGGSGGLHRRNRDLHAWPPLAARRSPTNGSRTESTSRTAEIFPAPPPPPCESPTRP